MPEGKTLETVSDPAAMFATTGLNAGENERDADQAGDIDPQASTTSPFIPSDGPDDPDRTWYYPE